MASWRSVRPCGRKSKTWSISIRRRRAACRASALLSGQKRRTCSRHSRGRRPACKTSAQSCAPKKRQRCWSISSLRRILQGQWLAFYCEPGLHSHHCAHYDSPCINSFQFVWFIISQTLLGDICFCFFVFDSLRSQNAELSGSVKALESSQEELKKRLAAVQLQHQQENAKLQTQLDEADSHSRALKREVVKSFAHAPCGHVCHLLVLPLICQANRDRHETNTSAQLIKIFSQGSLYCTLTLLKSATCHWELFGFCFNKFGQK